MPSSIPVCPTLVAFADPAQTITELLYLGLLLAITVLHTIKSLRKADEVQLAGARFSFSTGALMGLGGAFLLVVVVANAPSAADLVASLAASPDNGLPPAAIGFLLGTMTTMVLVFVGGIAAHAVWTRQMARR